MLKVHAVDPATPALNTHPKFQLMTMKTTMTIITAVFPDTINISGDLEWI